MDTVPINKFGKDHWSLLAYIETCAVDGNIDRVAPLDKRKLRCNWNTHPMHHVNANFFSVNRTQQLNGNPYPHSYSTIIANNEVIEGHDDWDCLNDLEKAGLIDILSEANACVVLMDPGFNAVYHLRRHRANGGKYSEFHIEKLEDLLKETLSSGNESQ